MNRAVMALLAVGRPHEQIPKAVRDVHPGSPVRQRDTISERPAGRRPGAVRRVRRTGINKIIVGLGNPGEQYAQTRHNVGWMVLDRLADRAGWSGRGRNKDAAVVVGGRFNGLDVVLVKPLTFMNESGLAVRKILAREHAPLGEMLVIVDDLALPFGKLRFREGGGPGGHNGLRSIIDELESEAFSRLRVGIGAPERSFIDHVLNKFRPEEKARLDELLDTAADAAETWARVGTNKAASQFNSFELRPADEDRVAPAGEVDGPPNADGVRKTRTGWRKVLGRKVDSDPGADRSDES